MVLHIIRTDILLIARIFPRPFPCSPNTGCCQDCMGQCRMNEWLLGHLSRIPRRFAGADDIVINLAKEREPGDIECNPLSLIITGI